MLKKGREPLHGKNAKINWIFNIELNHPDGFTSSISEIQPYKKITANTLIAEKIPRLLGEYGIDIFGNVIPCIIR